MQSEVAQRTPARSREGVTLNEKEQEDTEEDVRRGGEYRPLEELIAEMDEVKKQK